MITEKELQAAVVERLKRGGFDVFEIEARQGNKKPSVSVAVLPSSVELQACGGATEIVTYSVEIAYDSETEKISELLTAAKKIKRLFLYDTLDVGDRYITIPRMEYEREKGTLYAEFDVEVTQLRDAEEEIETMSELELGGNI